MDKLKRIRLSLILVVIISFYSCESKNELAVNNLILQIENQKKKLDSIDLNKLETAFNAFHYNIKNINGTNNRILGEIECQKTNQ